MPDPIPHKEFRRLGPGWSFPGADRTLTPIRRRSPGGLVGSPVECLNMGTEPWRALGAWTSIHLRLRSQTSPGGDGLSLELDEKSKCHLNDDYEQALAVRGDFINYTP